MGSERVRVVAMGREIRPECNECDLVLRNELNWNVGKKFQRMGALNI